jgi:hypothetical protein
MLIDVMLLERSISCEFPMTPIALDQFSSALRPLRFIFQRLFASTKVYATLTPCLSKNVKPEPQTGSISCFASEDRWTIAGNCGLLKYPPKKRMPEEAGDCR